MKWRNVFAIVKKDLTEVRQNKAAWLPMVIAPAIIILLLPLGMILIPQASSAGMQSFTDTQDLGAFLNNLPVGLSQIIQGLDPFQEVIVLILGYLLAPLFLIFPLAFSSVVAAESFAGERERKTMEALLYTPATDIELFAGKVVTALIPALGISWLSFVGYTIVLDIAAFPVFGYIWFPLPSWYPLIFWITPALAMLGILVTVLISSKVQTFMGAYQLSAALVVLVLGLIGGQLSGILYLSVGTGILIGLFFWLVDAILAYIAIRNFKRSTLLLGLKP
jgi:ABC-2 type transport system permease protein